MPQNDVHIIKKDSDYTVYQETDLVIPGLNWEQAVAVANKLGGKIIVHSTAGDAATDPRLVGVASRL